MNDIAKFSFAAGLAAVALGSLSAMAATEPSPLGEWARGDGVAKVRIEPCGSNLCAINTWIRPDDKDEHVGDKLVMTVKQATPAHWEGTAYDAQRSLSYKMTLDVEANSMTSRGCILAGILCKGVSWTRIGN